ncbi:hypothetical protein [Cupriavidus sp.]|uniref:hypothetical protein n=1 Tax=Cupriavidus sp. TaxID=1873897 RepID=UPI0025C7099E|nr:hypothetical protein [Cupriavidus sp.]MCA3183028.1 hypothetical protein [Cupriavidus sp.]MCA3190413.1 hypothetical protein [Cupriavidus sp.]MCA3197117.1 hypothetical protein [Cupriavidus sp.]MCA3202394.1 hypothetical protein [Cupriavidus sp.]MCA3205862.1 hypothetical protein [Cupriavidus sp.]
MEPETVGRIFTSYTVTVFFFLLPRFVLIEGLAKQRYAFIAFAILGIFLVNIVVAAILFRHGRIPAFYIAMVGPFMSLWVSLLSCEFDTRKDKPT